NLAAARATPEFLVIDLGKWLELRNYIRLGHPFYRRIAAKAPRKWDYQCKKIKAADYFNSLLIGVLRTRTVTGLYHRMHQQAPVPREQGSVFALHYVK